IEGQFAATENSSGNVAYARMALVYGQETTDMFFALLDDTLVLDVAYTHSPPALEPAITAADPKIAYDDFRHRLVHAGIVSKPTRDALNNAAANVFQQDPNALLAFQNALAGLFARSENLKGSFFTRYPELEGLYND